MVNKNISIAHKASYNSLKNFLYWLSFFVVFGLIFVMVAGNSNNPDTFASEYSYNMQSLSNEGYLIRLIQHFFYHFSLEYVYYRTFLYALGYTFLFLGSKIVLRRNLSFFLLYAIFPMMIDATQTENFVAMCFLFFALSFLRINSFKNKIIAAIFIIVAGGFHSAILVFLLFLLFPNVYSRKKLCVFSFFVVLVSFVLVFLRSELSIALNAVASVLLKNDNRVDLYFADFNGFGFLLFWLIHTFMFLIVLDKNRELKDDQYLNMAIRVLAFSFILFPLYSLNSNFFRLSRDLIPIVITSVLIKNKQQTRPRFNRDVVLLVALLFFLFSYQILLQNYETIFKHFLDSYYF